MAKSPFQSILDKNQFFIEDLRKKSAAWIYTEVEKLQKQRITPNVFMKDNTNKQSSFILPGNLYFYAYNPKTKDTLPYYDAYPLVFPFTKTNDGWIGLNMHYLPYNLRIQLFDALWSLRKNNKLDATNRLKLSWATIQSLSKFNLAQPCVKRYLFTHMTSVPIIIESEHWLTALMLPIQRFKKQNDQYIWGDSIKQSRK